MKRHRRQGFSMLEAIIYLSLSAVLVSLTAQWFHVVFQVASENKVRQQQHASLKRLASDFRADVVSAADVSFRSSQQLSLGGVADEEVVYRISAGRVDRIVGDAKQPTRQEAYRDLEDLRLEFVNDDSASSPKYVSLNVFRRIKQKKLEQKKLEQDGQQQPAEKSGLEKRLLQIRCGPRPSELEAVR